MEIGIIGLGAMGKAIARNLAAAGYTVKAWNRFSGEISGVQIVETPAQTLHGDVALTLLSDDAAIRSVLLDTHLLSQARPGLVHVVVSTISVAFAEELLESHHAVGINYVATPFLYGRMSRPRETQCPGRRRAGGIGKSTAGAGGYQQAHLEHGRGAADSRCRKDCLQHDDYDGDGGNSRGRGADRGPWTAARTLFRADLEYLVRQPFLSRLFGQHYQRSLRAGIQGCLRPERLASRTRGGGTAGAKAAYARSRRHQMFDAVNAGGGDKDWSVMADYTIRSAS